MYFLLHRPDGVRRGRVALVCALHSSVIPKRCSVRRARPAGRDVLLEPFDASVGRDVACTASTRAHAFELGHDGPDGVIPGGGDPPSVTGQPIANWTSVHGSGQSRALLMSSAAAVRSVAWLKASFLPDCARTS
jgi:hypothetical protein